MMMRYHEVLLYKRFALELDPTYDFSPIKIPKSLTRILSRHQLKDPLDIKSLEDVIGGLAHTEEKLTLLRNKIIDIFLKIRDQLVADGKIN